MGDGFSWESNRGCKKKKNNNNIIRLVPTRIESHREGRILSSGEQLQKKGFLMPERVREVGDPFEFYI